MALCVLYGVLYMKLCSYYDTLRFLNQILLYLYAKTFICRGLYRVILWNVYSIDRLLKNLEIENDIMYALLLSSSNEKTEGRTRLRLFVYFVVFVYSIPQIHSAGLCNLISSFALGIFVFILLESKWAQGLTKVYIFK
jgi:hypothetical protein